MGGGGPRGYTGLGIWHRGIQLAKQVYIATKDFPLSERYGLVSQMRRAAVSVPSNIAEGEARRRPAEFQHFLRIALGPLAELDTQLVIADELGLVHEKTVAELRGAVTELQMMVGAFLPKRQD
jgi:four helix bundle protein